jgi:hypothetical protein
MILYLKENIVEDQFFCFAKLAWEATKR